jgi:peptide/nickel transport system substrate-binding protein
MGAANPIGATMSDHEHEIRAALSAVERGALSRRRFIADMAAAGVPLSLSSALLAPLAPAHAQANPTFVYRPTRRGGGGLLRILMWQGPTHLNVHFGTGAKDVFGARMFYEPLARYDREGHLEPMLAAEVPSFANGGVARDGLSVTWKLKRGVVWHDGEPFTADDVVTTWEFARHPETGAFTFGSYAPVKMVRKLDSHTVRLEFAKPTPVWAEAFVLSVVLPHKHFAAYIGAKSREAPANLAPVGTGPYRFAAFRPGDFLRGEINPAYHLPNRPHFDAFEIKGGGDAVSAARAVLQSGDYDLGWNLQVEDEVLTRIERGGRGRMDFAPGGDIEYLMLNHTDPWKEIDGERSHPSTRHPFLLEPAVRQALAHLVDRDAIQKVIYGRSGVPTSNFLNNPAAFNSTRTGPSFDLARANALLDAGGWVRGADGVRAKAGQRLKMLFQTSASSPRQKTQAIIKHSAQQAGIDMELKAVAPAVFFGGDIANTDTNTKFYADLQMFTVTRGGPDPGRFMELFCSWLIASKANKWNGRNISRWRSDEYDTVFRTAEGEIDPVRRAALLIRLNDLVCADHAIVPIVVRPKPTALANSLQASIGGWGSEAGSVHDWYRA